MVVLVLSALHQQSSSFASDLIRRPGLPSPAAHSLPSFPTLTIPAETEAAAQILSGIHTQVSHVDDRIVARLLRPVLVNGRVALPSGTLLGGRITRVQPARRLHRPAELALRFEEITLPDGDVEPITAVLASLDNPPQMKTRVDSEGYLKGGRSWKGVAGGLTALGIFAAAKATISGAASLSPILPAGGVGLLGYEMLWRRGSEVHVPPQTRCRIRLDFPLTVHVPW